MRIGVPRERKKLEHRVAITPSGAKELIKKGHQVIIEKGAGNGSFFENSEYIEAGCKIVSTLKEVWTEAELLVKVKEPHEEEFQYLRPDLIIFDYLHLAGLPEVAKALLKSGTTGIAYELVEPEPNHFVLLEPMSEIAGKLSVQNGAQALLSQNGGRGVLLGGTEKVPCGNVTIIGAGVSGLAACQVALGMGAKVTIFDIDKNKLNKLNELKNPKLKCEFSNAENITKALKDTDLLIGAVLIPGAKAPHVVTRLMLKSMQRSAVIVDISIDQGGCVETSRPTSLAEPTFEVDGIIHYCVPNMPSQTARTSTLALTLATLPYIKAIADFGLEAALAKDPALKKALSTQAGKLVSSAAAQSLGM